jgi:hypothetical protein
MFFLASSLSLDGTSRPRRPSGVRTGRCYGEMAFTSAVVLYDSSLAVGVSRRWRAAACVLLASTIRHAGGGRGIEGPEVDQEVRLSP